VLHVDTIDGQQKIVRGAGHPGDPDLVMHYVVCRAAGLPVLGPAPRDLIGAVPRPAILSCLAAELGWGLEHGSEAYAVLNACRGLIFLADGHVISKVAGGLAALDRGLGDAAVIERALDQQQGNAPRRAIGPDATAFVQSAVATLRAAARAAS
jgi:streptomycin 3"-adenylyltransferase